MFFASTSETLKSFAIPVSKRLLPALTTLCVASLAFAAPTPTWEYNADSNALPSASGQPFAGGTNVTTHASIVDIGGGDLVLRIDTQDTNGSTYFQQDPNTNSGTEWNVTASTGYSIEWRVRLDSVEANDSGGADIHVGDGTNYINLRLIRAANGGAGTVILKSGHNNTVLDSAALTNPGDFHTYRIDKINNTVDVYVDGVLTFDGVVDPTPSTLDRVRFGDPTGTADGNYDTQFFRTYQNGPIPEPATLGLLSVGLLMLMRKHRN